MSNIKNFYNYNLQSFRNRMTAYVMEDCDKAAKVFMERYPKRALELVEGMGSCFWVVDGEIVHYSFDNTVSWDGAESSCTYKLYNLFSGLLKPLEDLNEALESGEYLATYIENKVYKGSGGLV